MSIGNKPMIAFIGTSHAAQHLRFAAIAKGVPVTQRLDDADVIFISEDTPTDESGKRNTYAIEQMVEGAAKYGVQIVLTSQVEPGFTRKLGIHNIFHQAETLRIKDAEARALKPDYIAVGGEGNLHPAYAEYLAAFECPILRMTWEEAEWTKIAVNMMLAAQVDYTNRLSALVEQSGARWAQVKRALHYDKRIGPECYLTPGRWQDSQHLLRDAVTLAAME